MFAAAMAKRNSGCIPRSIWAAAMVLMRELTEVVEQNTAIIERAWNEYFG
jgi:hypothetical protein